MDNSNVQWSPSSWRQFKILQQPVYEDLNKLEATLSKLHSLPPLVHPKEVDRLKESLAKAGRGEIFLLQGGDCAERFVDCNKQSIEAKFKILLQMSLIVIYGARIPVVRIARMAGQFAKPRSSPMEAGPSGTMIESFKGDNVNSFEPDPERRKPDPDRLLSAYFHSVATLNYLRTMIVGGVADLHAAPSWSLDNVLSDQTRQEYSTIIDQIMTGLDFFRVIRADTSETFHSIDMYTSHEALLLNYEEALTEAVDKSFYNLGAHFLWVGDRTRQIDGAHVHYFKGISNPIGIKCGPTTSAGDLQALVRILNPNKEEGRLTIITRYGADKVASLLPIHIQAVKETGIPVVWCCDPCHGNTTVTAEGFKTRKIESITSEILATFDVHAAQGTILGGVHLELTGEDVTECTGGSVELTPGQLGARYETFCDPRLNYTQSLDIAFLVARVLKERLQKRK